MHDIRELYVIVTGSRTWADAEFIHARLQEAFYPEGEHYDLKHLIVGDARGADQIAREWVERQKITDHDIISKTFVADWEHHGRYAGPMRNGEMIRWVRTHTSAHTNDTVTCLAFHHQNSRGTADMLKRMKAAGFHGRRFSI